MHLDIMSTSPRRVLPVQPCDFLQNIIPPPLAADLLIPVLRSRNLFRPRQKVHSVIKNLPLRPLAFIRNQLLCKLFISHPRTRLRAIFRHRQAVINALPHLHRTRNPRLKHPYLLLETLRHFLRQNLAQLRPGLAHGHQDARNPQPRIDPLPDFHHRPQKILHPHHSQKLGVHRDNDFIRGSQSIDCQSPKGRAGINQNVIILLPQRLQNLFLPFHQSFFERSNPLTIAT